jgi:hypothetical protein
MHKTHDYIHHYHGHWRPGGICRVQIYEEEGRPPVIICNELPENGNTSITNMVEYLAAEVARAHSPHLFDATGEPFIWLEHYPRDPRAGLGAEYRRVRFDSYTPRQVLRAGGVRRLPLGWPHWSPISRAAVEALIGSQCTEQWPLPWGGGLDKESRS